MSISDSFSELHAKSTPLSRIILGGQDGLVNVLGVVLGVAIASNETRIILAAGLAATFAESISMAAVVYTSEMAERDHYVAVRIQKEREIDDSPKQALDEIRAIYQKKGFSDTLVEQVAKHISKRKSVFLATLIREGTGLAPIRTKDVVFDSAIVGVSAIVGSFIPLFPFFFLPPTQSIGISLVLSALALFIVGVYKAKTTVGKPMRSGIGMTVIGMGAALVGYGIGLFFK